DDIDNCTEDSNPEQRDTDDDGIGNACDADFDNDCAVNFADLGVLKSQFFQAGDLDTDMDGDGATNFTDLGLLKGDIFDAPGPSAVASSCAASMCEGTYVCIVGSNQFNIGDRTRIGFWGKETCPGSTTLADGSVWNLLPGTCAC
ncbi:MAG: hypothetical protein AAFN78_09520, partial [Pseudomonadota bacterium]